MERSGLHAHAHREVGSVSGSRPRYASLFAVTLLIICKNQSSILKGRYKRFLPVVPEYPREFDNYRSWATPASIKVRRPMAK